MLSVSEPHLVRLLYLVGVLTRVHYDTSLLSSQQQWTEGIPSICPPATPTGGEGNGNPLQYSCLENPVGRGAWWAAIHRVAQSRTRLKQLSMHACIGEGNGNPLQYFCLENPRDREAWWAAVYGVTQSRTQLKRLSSRSIRSSRIEVEASKQCDKNRIWE